MGHQVLVAAWDTVKQANFHSSGPTRDHSAGLWTVLTLSTEMHTAVQYAKKQDCGASIPPLSSDLTVTGDVQFHQLHEVGNLRGKSLYFIVTQAQFAQVQKPEERLGQEENKTGSAAVLWKMCRLTSGQASILGDKCHLFSTSLLLRAPKCSHCTDENPS